jgi:hypothetical protein
MTYRPARERLSPQVRSDIAARQDADDLLRVTLDQVRHRPTIPPTVQAD